MSTVSVCQQRPPSALPAAPRPESRRCALCQSRGEKKTDLLTHLKVENRSGSVAEGSPARDGAQRSEREKGGDSAPGDSKGRSPWRAFGDFPRDGKVTRGRRGGAPSPRGCGGVPPLWGAPRGPKRPPRKKTILTWNRSGRCRPQKSPERCRPAGRWPESCRKIPHRTA